MADQIAKCSRTPDLRVIATMIIMPMRRPMRRPMVLTSMPAVACSGVSNPAMTIRIAPSKAMTERFRPSLISTP